MQPTLYEGDIVTIRECERYEIGDVLVFTHEGEILVHRLLRQRKQYYCKGDNAFRLEAISRGQILGKVVSRNGKPNSSWPLWKIQLSYRVSRDILRHWRNIEKVKQSITYKLYLDLVLRNGGKNMMYRKNETMDYIQADHSSLAVFDPNSGDTHFFDETGIDILSVLATPCTFEELLFKLSNIYSVKPEDIRSDVEEFLAESVLKKVIIII